MYSVDILFMSSFCVSSIFFYFVMLESSNLLTRFCMLLQTFFVVQVVGVWGAVNGVMVRE